MSPVPLLESPAASRPPVEDSAREALPWWEPDIDEAAIRAVEEVLRGGWVNEGPRSAAFARRVARDLGAPFVHTAPSGTTALFLALRACGVGPGDEVIVPDLTFVATSSAVRLCGAEALPVDVLPGSLCLDPEAATAAVGPRTAALLPVHMNGRPADMPALRALAERAPRRLAIVEDACQALGSRSAGRALGTLGDAGCFSLAPNKVITAGQGGLVATARPELADEIARLKDHGRLDRGANRHPAPGYNFKLSDLAAALAEAQWEGLDARLRLLARQHVRYRAALRDAPGLRFLAADRDPGVVPLWVDVYAERADALADRLRAEGIGVRRFWPPLHSQAADRRPGPFPVADRAAAEGLWLPNGPRRGDADVDRVAEAVRRACRALHGGAWA